ncbi:hypothetical protein DER44DRAFT_666985 [Fusarium oxysporum]|nr:hypothetical protein DER44DRAFT_666985 [Fusarium oxysporum]
METPSLPCANCSPDGTSCHNTGKSSCSNCRLVVYCSSECQKAHWSVHKVDCKSPLTKATWEPEWAAQGREPAFVGSAVNQFFGGTKYLFGNIPALDVLRLDANEGEAYQGQLRLLFAASGDSRNAIKTIGQLPSSYQQPIDIVMNDRDIDIVARNAIMLLIALTVDDQDEAVDCMIHIWYSASIRKSHCDILKHRVRPLIENVCDKIKGKPANRVLGKTWTFEERSLRLALKKSSWDKVLSFLDMPQDLTADKADEVRRAVTLAPSRVDYRERHFLFLNPSLRVAKQRYREDGLLLPFGAQRSEFCEPNPTFFQSADHWPMFDSADPLDGWLLNEVEKTPTGLATFDIYGKLFHYVRSMLVKFLARAAKSTVAFQLLQVDAANLPDHVDGSFDRIEVSNISDGGYLGIHRTVALMAPVLREPSINPHATLITLFMNMVEETLTPADKMGGMNPTSKLSKRLTKFLPPQCPMRGVHDPYLVKFMYACGHVREFDDILERFAKEAHLARMPLATKGAMKEEHTIVEKWPHRLKLDPDEEGAKEEFDMHMSGGPSGRELYLEWKRVQV